MTGHYTQCSEQRRAFWRSLIVSIGLVCSATQTNAQQPPSPPPPTPPAIIIDASGLTIIGLKPASSVAIFGSTRRSFEYYERQEMRGDILADDDKDGQLRFDVDGGLPWKSVWVVVDLSTGLYAIAAPEGFPLEEVEFPGRGIGSALNALESEGDFVNLLWVRPSATTGAAAWMLAVGDGGASDDDKKGGNHKIKADVSKFEPVGQSPVTPPDKFAAGDVLVGIDANTLTIFASKLAN